MIRRTGYPPQSKTFDTKQDAELWIAENESAMIRGIWRPSTEAERTTIKEAFERYLSEVTPDKKGAKREKTRIMQLQASNLGVRFMSDIRGMDMAKYRDDRLKSVSASTVQKELALISHLFTIAKKEWGMDCLSNPIKSVRMPKLPKPVERRLDHDEESRLMVELSGELKQIVIFAIETGMRRGEIMGMRWGMVRGNAVALPDTKNGTSRTVPLSSVARGVLSALPRRIDGRVWSMYIDDVTRGFQAACKRSGIVGMTFHTLRHEAISRWFDRGLSIMEVSAITGHKTLAMLKRYAHLSIDDLARKLG